MELSEFQELLSPRGQEALRAAVDLQPRETEYLSHYTALCRIFPAQIARVALETAILRNKAATKFPFASKMYFTGSALEQASSYEVSTYRCRRYTGFSQILDLGCSIGSDSLALASHATVLGVDLDILRLAMAVANLEAVHPEARVLFLQANLEEPLSFSCNTSMAIFFDPARRSEHKRLQTVSRYHPPLSAVNNWLDKIPSVGVKMSPGVDLSEVSRYQAEVEFISLRGELKEAVLWFGDLKSATRRATLLPGPWTMSVSETDKNLELTLCEPRSYIYEPDPAILRAGLVRLLGAQIGACQLDPDIAYLTGDRKAETPFATAYLVEEWLPFNLKRLRSILRKKRVEQVVIKKRGSPLRPQDLIHDLHLKEGSGNSPDERVVFLTHLRGKPIAIICRSVL